MSENPYESPSDEERPVKTELVPQKYVAQPMTKFQIVMLTIMATIFVILFLNACTE